MEKRRKGHRLSLKIFCAYVCAQKTNVYVVCLRLFACGCRKHERKQLRHTEFAVRGRMQTYNRRVIYYQQGCEELYIWFVPYMSMHVCTVSVNILYV